MNSCLKPRQEAEAVMGRNRTGKYKSGFGHVHVWNAVTDSAPFK
jgi:hypothetical protein